MSNKKELPTAKDIVDDFRNMIDSYKERKIEEYAELRCQALREENERLRDILSGLVNDIGNMISDHDIEWQQAGYYNEAKLLLKGGDNE